MLIITLAAVTASRITVVCLPAVNVNGISAADLIVEALGQLSVSAAIESVLGGRFNRNYLTSEIHFHFPI